MKGVLPNQEIQALIPNVIINGDPSCVRTASYDMRIGDEYYLHDQRYPDGHAIRSRGQGGIVIPPNGLLMCTMYETLKLPPDVVGHSSLKVALLMKGVMMASQSQIDAGYEGSIFGMLYNLSQRDVCLRGGDFVLKLELMRLEQPTSTPYDNTISRSATLRRFIDAPLISSLVEIREDADTAVKEVREAKDKLNFTQVAGVLAGSLLTAGVAFLTAFAGWHFASDSKVEQLAQKVAALETQSKVSEATAILKSRVDELEKQNKALETRLGMAGVKTSPDTSDNRVGTGDVDQSQPKSNAQGGQTAPTQGSRSSERPEPPPQR